MKKTLATASALLLTVSLAACSAPGETTTTEPESVQSDASVSKTELTYSRSQGPYSILFEEGIIPILEKEGYSFEGIDFSDLLNADIALNDGDVDFNVEQHTAYLENFNSANDGDLVPITPTPTVPAGIYSDRHDNLNEVSDGSTIALPSDASNRARAYYLLQKLGWVTIDESVPFAEVTSESVVENPHNLVFTEMDSLSIPPVQQDFDYVVLTGSIVYNAKIDPSTALETEDIQPNLVLQVVVKEENKDTEWAKAISDAYHSDEFKQYLEENNNGLWWIPEELK